MRYPVIFRSVAVRGEHRLRFMLVLVMQLLSAHQTDTGYSFLRRVPNTHTKPLIITIQTELPWIEWNGCFCPLLRHSEFSTWVAHFTAVPKRWSQNNQTSSLCTSLLILSCYPILIHHQVFLLRKERSCLSLFSHVSINIFRHWDGLR